MNILVDVNILVAAHRADHAAHAKALLLLDGIACDGFAICPHIINGFLRLVTHARLFARPSSIDLALAAVAAWRSRPRCEVLDDTAETWEVFARLCRQHGSGGDAISDLHLAALAMAHDRVLVSSGGIFAGISGLRWQAL